MATRLATKIKELFGQDSLAWIDRSYLTDWTVATLLWGLSGLARHSPVFERNFSVDDPLISHPHTNEQVSGYTNNVVALYVPLTLVGAVGGFRGSVMEIHHGILSVWAARGFALLITEFLKHRVGRLRPDFLARCKWDTVLHACTGDASTVIDGRKSFPSGHSSGAFAGMTFLSVWLAGKTAAWCFHSPSPAGSIRTSRLGAVILTALPLFWATYVAISRIEDYRHHKEDVIVGSLIGIVSALLCYHIFWPSPFSVDNFTPESAGRPRALYTDGVGWRSRNTDFELTRLEEEIENV